MIKRLAVRWSFLFPIYLLAAAALNAPSPLRFGTPGIDARLSLAVIAAALFFVPARYSGWPMALTGAIGAWRTALFMGFGPAPPDLGLAALSIFCGAIGFGRLATQGGWARRFAEFALSAAPLALAAGRGQWIAAAVALGFAAVGASRRNATPDPRWAAALIGLLLTAGGVLGIRGVEWRREAGVREALAELPAAKADQPYERIFFQRGVSFTAEGGARYGSKESRQMLAALVAYGVDAIALIPYGRFGRDGKGAETGGWENEEGMEILTRQAHRQGMRVMLKPHTRKPREADLADAESRARWFARYEEFVAHYAAFARRVHADLLSVGCEFEWLTAYEAEWRRVIARARREYPGPLVYSPNFGKEFESIAFWDALDYIGIDNYYPLPDDYSAAQQAAKIEAVHKRFGKPVLFTEAGFSAAEGAHRAPWEDESAKALSLDEQARCYEALLREFYGKPWFSGVYWWKVGTNGYGGPANNSMTPWRKPAMDVVKRWYARAR